MYSAQYVMGRERSNPEATPMLERNPHATNVRLVLSIEMDEEHFGRSWFRLSMNGPKCVVFHDGILRHGIRPQISL
jgi:hypothetical protein